MLYWVIVDKNWESAALYPPSAFDTPSHTIVGFKVFLRATQAAAFGWLNPSAIGGKRS